jgi:hypothetical protein
MITIEQDPLLCIQLAIVSYCVVPPSSPVFFPRLSCIGAFLIVFVELSRARLKWTPLVRIPYFLSWTFPRGLTRLAVLASR